VRAIIDRFEGEFAILELEKEYKKIERVMLPAEVREGDVLFYCGKQWVVDPEATRKRKEEIEKLAEELWED
jgi:hypothetical protein